MIIKIIESKYEYIIKSRCCKFHAVFPLDSAFVARLKATTGKLRDYYAAELIDNELNIWNAEVPDAWKGW